MVNKIIAAIVAAILSFAAAEPATPTDVNANYAGVSVCVEMDTPITEIQYGNVITLRCVVTGVEKPYRVQWQHSRDKTVWEDILCEEEVYEFVLAEDNAGTYYRVVILTGSQ